MIWKNIGITILCINLLCGLIISVKTLFYKGKNEDIISYLFNDRIVGLFPVYGVILTILYGIMMI